MNPYIIAELGCVHVGNMNRAKMLIELAAKTGVNCVKFQKRNPIESVPKAWHNTPHPNQIFAYGKTYLEHRQNLELTIEQHAELQKHCHDCGVEYSTSVWDLTSAKEVVSIRPAAIKIPSACNHNLELLNFLCTAFAGDIYISLGMTTFIERQLLDQIFFGYSAKIVVFHCTSAYPCPFENLYLNEISYLANKYDRTGFSNHGYGISADSAALALGARYFERHFIDDRSFRHTDASASLEPTGMAKLCRDLHNVHKALEYKPPQLDKLELEQRNKLRTDTDQRGLVES